MDKVKQNVRANKAYTCESCGKPIAPGTQYQWKKPFRGRKATRHQTCPTWRMSERVPGAMASAYGAQEDAHTALEELNFGDPAYLDEGGTPLYERFIEDVKAILESCATEAEMARDETQDSFDNMPDGLQQGDTGQMLEERIDLLEDWFDNLNSWSPDYDQPQDGQDLLEWVEEVLDSAGAVVDELEA